MTRTVVLNLLWFVVSFFRLSTPVAPCSSIKISVCVSFVVATGMQLIFSAPCDVTDKRTTLLQALEIGSQFFCKSLKTLKKWLITVNKSCARAPCLNVLWPPIENPWTKRFYFRFRRLRLADNFIMRRWKITFGIHQNAANRLILVEIKQP